MKKFLRNLVIATATILGLLMVVGVGVVTIFTVVSFLVQFKLTWYIVLSSVISFILIAMGWRLADDNGWIK
jgi:membrane protein implicated in regulation of membrane protease activity